jgi:hypothetical protein
MFDTARMMLKAGLTIRNQNTLIRDLAESLGRAEHERECVELAYMRISRDMLEQFLIALDQPENQDQIRERITMSLGFYRDEIAVREEHV